MFKCCFQIFKSKKNELLSFSDHIVGLKLLSICILAIKKLQLPSQPLSSLLNLKSGKLEVSATVTHGKYNYHI